MSNGTGDKPRPADKKKYGKNYDSIKWSKPKGSKKKDGKNGQ